jgi:hypothetical protein
MHVACRALSLTEYNYNAGGFDCPTYGQTATVYAPGSCKPVAHSTSIGAANFCFDTYTNDVTVGTFQSGV